MFAANSDRDLGYFYCRLRYILMNQVTRRRLKRLKMDNCDLGHLDTLDRINVVGPDTLGDDASRILPLPKRRAGIVSPVHCRSRSCGRQVRALHQCAEQRLTEHPDTEKPAAQTGS
jgi:hypothetical protein